MKDYQYHIFSPYRVAHWGRTWITNMVWWQVLLSIKALIWNTN